MSKENEDVEYFRKQLFKALKVPVHNSWIIDENGAHNVHPNMKDTDMHVTLEDGFVVISWMELDPNFTPHLKTVAGGVEIASGYNVQKSMSIPADVIDALRQSARRREE